VFKLDTIYLVLWGAGYVIIMSKCCKSNR